MDRKKFLKRGAIGLGSIIAIPGILPAAKGEDSESNSCSPTPYETAGPFPIKTPADWVRANVVGDRDGIPLLINVTVQNVHNNCAPMEDVHVDIWHCDARGNYSEYRRQLDGNFTHKHFLRGRQTTDNKGNASFVSIYPGWYPGRAPHIHLEVLRGKKSLLVTQIAFPDLTSKAVYKTQAYKGKSETSNSRDGLFRNSLAENMADSVTGNVKDGYTLNKVIKVEG